MDALHRKVMIVMENTEPRPKFRNAHDMVTFVLHACFFSSDFYLHATGPSAFTDHALHSSYTGLADEVSTKHWNDFDDHYGFVYSSPRKDSKNIRLKCVVLNDNLLVDILRQGDSEPAHYEINVMEHVADAEFKDFKKLLEYINTTILSNYTGSPSLSHN